MINTRFRRHMAGFTLPFCAAVLLLYFGGDLGLLFRRAEVTVWCSMAAFSLFGVALTHPLRLLALPYADLKTAWNKLLEHPVGAGMGFLGGCIVFAALLLTLSAPARAAEPPAASLALLPVLKVEQTTYWPQMPDPPVLAGQVEQETGPCPGRNCWNPRAELKTDREQGLGLGQFTRTTRFDAVAEVRAANPRALADYVWDRPGIYDPALQLRALVLKMSAEHERWTVMRSSKDRLAVTLAAYNGGRGSVLKRLLTCRGEAGCDEQSWFGHLERHAPQAKTVAAGYGQSFADINSKYPGRVFDRTDKYRPWFARS